MEENRNTLDEATEQFSPFVQKLRTELAAHPEIIAEVTRAAFPTDFNPTRQNIFQDLARDLEADQGRPPSSSLEKLEAKLLALSTEGSLSTNTNPLASLGASQPQSRLFGPLHALLREAATASTEFSGRVQDSLQRAAQQLSQISTPLLASAASDDSQQWDALMENHSVDENSPEGAPQHAQLRGTLFIAESSEVIVDALIVQPQQDWRGWEASLWVEVEEQAWLPVGRIEVGSNGYIDGAVTTEGFSLAPGPERRLKILLSHSAS